jgi:hypothetical protein
LRYTITILLFLLAATANAQALKGRVTDEATGKPLYPVTVVNLDTRQSAYSNEQGYFSIAVRPGDHVAFSYIGYKPQQKDIGFITASVDINVKMEQINYQLDEFTVRPDYTPYQVDSIRRRSTYQRPLAMPHANPFNSPISALAQLFAPTTKATFRFQKNYAKWESQLFVDSRYSPELVTQLTGLTGDSLAGFMNNTPMPYDYARTATDLEVKMWIRYNYKQWLKNGAKMIVTDSSEIDKK